jgi:hypothetical protein
VAGRCSCDRFAQGTYTNQLRRPDLVFGVILGRLKARLAIDGVEVGCAVGFTVKLSVQFVNLLESNTTKVLSRSAIARIAQQFLFTCPNDLGWLSET